MRRTGARLAELLFGALPSVYALQVVWGDEMTDRNDIVRQIEEKLGHAGSREIAIEMLDIMAESGEATFDATNGYQIVPIDEDRWLAITERAEARLH